MKTQYTGAACMVLLGRTKEGEFRILTVGRKGKNGLPPDPGEIGLAGGKIDPGEGPLTAAIRETKEETGIELDPENCIPLHFGKLEELPVYTFLCMTIPHAEAVPDGIIEGPEGTSIRWASFEDVATKGPFYRYNQEVLAELQALLIRLLCVEHYGDPLPTQFTYAPRVVAE